MAANSMSRSEVKAICDELECSPSSHSEPAKSGGKAKLIRHSATPAASGSTSELSKAYSGVPGFKGRFARGARQE